MATSALTPEFLAVSESRTAQRQLGFWPNLFTCWQQPLETGAFASCAALAQGASLMASSSGLDFPHALAPSTLSRQLVHITATNPRMQMNFIGASIFVFLCLTSSQFTSWKFSQVFSSSHNATMQKSDYRISLFILESEQKMWVFHSSTYP